MKRDDTQVISIDPSQLSQILAMAQQQQQQQQQEEEEKQQQNKDNKNNRKKNNKNNNSNNRTTQHPCPIQKINNLFYMYYVNHLIKKLTN